MGHGLITMFSKIVLVSLVLGGMAHAQAPPAESVAPASAVSPAAASSTPTPSPSAIEPGQPSGDIPDTTPDPASLLPDPPSLPSRKVSLIGGTIVKLDRVRDQFTMQIFGGGKMKIYFDPRTHFYRDGNEVPVSDLHRGDRVSVDTILNGSAIFARNIRLKGGAAGESQGIVVSYRGDNGELVMRDVLSPRPLKLRLTTQTRFMDHGHSASAGQLVRGTLVAVKFGSQKDGSNIAQEVSILATPGTCLTFVGRVTDLDLRTGLLVLTSATDGKTYEIYLDPSAVGLDDLRQAADVTVLTRFDGNRYVAQNVTVN